MFFFEGKEKRQMDGKFLVTMHTNCHFQLIFVVKIKKNVAVDKKFSFIFVFEPNLVPKMLEMAFQKLPDFKIQISNFRFQKLLVHTVG